MFTRPYRSRIFRDGRSISSVFTVFGIKVQARLVFFLVVGFIGFGVVPSFELLPIWAGVAFLSVLVHELGHALVARAFGSEPEIEFLFFGAATKFSSKGITPWRNAVIALAGPLAGIAVALPGALWMLSLVGPMDTLIALLDPSRGFTILSAEAGPWVGVAVWSLTWTGGVWGILNLVPVRAVDGGQVLSGLIKTITPRYGIPITEAIFGLTFLAGITWAILNRNLWIGFLIFMFGRPDLRQVTDWWARRQDGDAFHLLDQARAAYEEGNTQQARQLADRAHAAARGETARSQADAIRVASRLSTGAFDEAADIAEASPNLDRRIKLQTLAAAQRHQQVIDLVGSASGLSPKENSSVIFSLASMDRPADAIARANREPFDPSILLQALRASQHVESVSGTLAEILVSAPSSTDAQRAEAALLQGDPKPALELPNLDTRLQAVALAMAEGLEAVDRRFPDLEARAVPSVQVALHRSGRFDEAVEFANRHRFSDTSGLIAYNRAASEARLGRADDAEASLKASRRSGFDISQARQDPDFDGIRPELEALLG